MVGDGEQLVEWESTRTQLKVGLGAGIRAGVHDLHAESDGTTAHCSADAPHTHHSEHGVVQVISKQEVRRPTLPFPCRHHPSALHETAARSKEQSDGGVGGGVGEDIWGVTHRYAAPRAGGEIDVVQANGNLGDHPQPRGRVDERGVDRIGEHREQTVDRHNRSPDPVRRHRVVALPHLDDGHLFQWPERNAPWPSRDQHDRWRNHRHPPAR